MRTITIDINGAADIRVDGMLLVNGEVAGRPRMQDAPVPQGPPTNTGGTGGAAVMPPVTSNDFIRHDTPREVAIAATCHEAHRQYCRTLSDVSVPMWTDATGEERANLITLVRAIEDGSATTPEDVHARWCAEKKDQGWTYGPQKSLVAKTHPNLVEYAQLTPAQRTKDRLFFAIASALLAPST